MQLTATQSAALVGMIATYLTEPDFETVLERYLGQKGIKDVKPINATIQQISVNCMTAAVEEGLVSDYLRRVLEHKWAKEPLRYAVLGAAPEFAKPGLDIGSAVAVVEAGLNALIAGLGNPKIFTAVGEHRKEIVELDRALNEFEACKRLHDALHTLQIKGAPWLGADDSDGSGGVALPVAQFASLIDAAAQPPAGAAGSLPDAIGEAALAWTATLKQAAVHLLTGIDGAAGVVANVVRAVLGKEPARINEAMFGVSRDLPVKRMMNVFNAAAAETGAADSAVANAASGTRLLGDAIRSRVAAHSLWQDVDAGFYRIESVFAFADKDFLGKFAMEWQRLRKTLFMVTERAANKTTGIDSGVNNALVAYEGALPAPNKDPSAEDSSRLDMAMQELRAQSALLGNTSRLQFFAVDGALKADCATLLAIRQPLAVLLGKVKVTWFTEVPP